MLQSPPKFARLTQPLPGCKWEPFVIAIAAITTLIWQRMRLKTSLAAAGFNCSLGTLDAYLLS